VGGLAVAAGAINPTANWEKLIATVPIALDTTTHKAWLSDQYPMPNLPDGSPIDVSTYLRVAWMKEGLKAGADSLLGTGFDRNAFGRVMQARYGTMLGHSHSSVVDLLIGIGIPGLLLWFGWLISLLWLAIRGFDQGWGYALLLIVIDFAIRSFIDSNIRDHMLQMFLFLIGVLAIRTAVASPTTLNASSRLKTKKV
jgi:hypothetical protein